MRLPEIELDDRRFQDLVSEARMRITRACPEWTEHNVSDPGITLIELFAWMTEMTIYRLNRVPDKLHVALLELLGIRLDGPSARAPTSLRFRLAGAADRADPDPRRRDRGRHAAHAPPRSRSSSRSTRTSRSRRCARPRTCSSAAARSRTSASPTARRARRAPTSSPFGSPPQVGDALYLGFEEPLGPPAHADRRRRLAGARRRRQPRGPAAALGGLPGRRRVGATATVLEDLTGGFNYGSGTVELELPPRSAIAAARRATACTGCAAGSTRRRAPAAPATTYSHAAGDLLDHRRADGRAAARRRTPSRDRARDPRRVRRHARPDLPAAQPPGAQAGTRRDARGPGPRVRRLGALGAARRTSSARPSSTATSCSTSSRGEVELGPAIRETDGGWTQYGAVPPKGAVLRFTRYRHGGGREGNVTAGHADRAQEHDRRRRHGHQPGRRRSAASTPRSSSHARQRASMEIRSRYRAVTAEDFEFLAGEASPRVARAVCIPPRDGGAGAAAPRPAHLPRRPPARPTTSCMPDEDAAAPRSPSTSTSGA